MFVKTETETSNKTAGDLWDGNTRVDLNQQINSLWVGPMSPLEKKISSWTTIPIGRGSFPTRLISGSPPYRVKSTTVLVFFCFETKTFASKPSW